MTNKMPVKQWLAIRKKAGRKIDPKRLLRLSGVTLKFSILYGVDPDLPRECQQVGRDYFACAPGSDIWVWFGDLPKATAGALWKKHKHKLAYPAGLEKVFEKLFPL